LHQHEAMIQTPNRNTSQIELVKVEGIYREKKSHYVYKLY